MNSIIRKYPVGIHRWLYIAAGLILVPILLSSCGDDKGNPVQPDTIAPTIEITSPLDGDTVFGFVPIQVTASDNHGVVRVAFLVDNIVTCNDHSRDWECLWSTHGYSDSSIHTIHAVAFDAAGNLCRSSDVNVVIMGNVPAWIQDLHISESTIYSVTLGWTAPMPVADTSTLVEYDIRYYHEPLTESNWDLGRQCDGEPIPDTAGTVQYFTVTGLVPLTTYYFAIKAADALGNVSPISNQASGETRAVPGVNDLNPSDIAINAVALSWTAPEIPDDTLISPQYDLRYYHELIDDHNWDYATQCEGEPNIGGAGSAETLTVAGLAAGTGYFFALRVIDGGIGISQISNSAFARTKNIPYIDDLRVGDSSVNSITLNWTSPGFDLKLPVVPNYDIRYSTSAFTVADWYNLEQCEGEPTPGPRGTAESYTVTGLHMGTTYYFGIRQEDSLNNLSGISNIIQGSTRPLFTETAIMDAGNFPVHMYSRDFDSDGNLDLMMSNYKNIGVFFGDGDATFSIPVYSPVTYGYAGIYPADFNSDGNYDVVVSDGGDQYHSGKLDKITVLFSEGTGLYGSPTDYIAGDRPLNIRAHDLDNDGDIDIVTANEFANNVSVLLNNGDGTFDSAIHYEAAIRCFGVEIADLDHDNDMDLVAVSKRYDGKVSILKNNGDGTFGDYEYVHDTRSGWGLLCVSDLNNDGNPDIVAMDDGVFWVGLNQGAADFIIVNEFQVDIGPTVIIPADATGDGYDDLVFIADAVVWTLENDGTATFELVQTTPLSYHPGKGCVGDLDGDGDIDLVVAFDRDDKIGILLNNTLD